MKTRHGRAFLFFLVLVGGLLADENWSHWTMLGGELMAERSAYVVVRSRHDEAGDQDDLGFHFVYELHNESGSRRARVLLYYRVLDPATRQWKEIDRDKPNAVHDVPPLGTVKASVYAPSVRGLYFESDVKWPELQAEEEPRKEQGDKAAALADVVAPNAGQSDLGAEFEGVPLSDKAGLKKAVDRYLEPQARFRATIVFPIPPGETSWMALVDDVGVDQRGTWRQYFDYWFAFAQKRTVVNGIAFGCSLQIVSVNDSEMVVKFEDVTADDLSGYLNSDPSFTWGQVDPIVVELARLEPKAASDKRP